MTAIASDTHAIARCLFLSGATLKSLDGLRCIVRRFHYAGTTAEFAEVNDHATLAQST
ncbi:MAG: hypothetical protein ACFB12_08215 [Leptolyngbyaceae cyanobacterium]